MQLPRAADSSSRSHEITLMVPDVGWGSGGRTGRSEEVPEDDVTLVEGREWLAVRVRR